MRAMRKTAYIEVVGEKKCSGRLEHMALVGQLEDDLHELKGKLDFSERRNKIADLRYTILNN